MRKSYCTVHGPCAAVSCHCLPISRCFTNDIYSLARSLERSRVLMVVPGSKRASCRGIGALIQSHLPQHRSTSRGPSVVRVHILRAGRIVVERQIRKRERRTSRIDGTVERPNRRLDRREPLPRVFADIRRRILGRSRLHEIAVILRLGPTTSGGVGVARGVVADVTASVCIHPVLV